MTNKPFSQACENNRGPILDVIKPLLKSASCLLEIGSGTGQHAAYFSQNLSQLKWQTSDLKDNHPGIRLWIDSCSNSNILQPIALNVLTDEWPQQTYDAVYSANTAHIMPWSAVEAMFKGVAKVLNQQGVFILYGPFKYQGQYTSQSNREFEAWLQSIDPQRSIRNFEAVNSLAEKSGLIFQNDIAMPANNQILVWRLK